MASGLGWGHNIVLIRSGVISLRSLATQDGGGFSLHLPRRQHWGGSAEMRLGSACMGANKTLANVAIIVAGRDTASRAQEWALVYTEKVIVQGDACADKARDFVGKGCPGREQQDKGTQENCSATWLAVSGFMVMRLVSCLSLAGHSNSGSFRMARASLSQDGFQREGF